MALSSGMRSDYARDVSGFVPQNVAPVHTSSLSARVNFKDRHPSIAQTVVSLLFWVFTIVLIGATIWSFFGANYKIVKVEEKCPDGWTPLGVFSCLSPSLAEQREKCLKSEQPAFNLASYQAYLADPNVKMPQHTQKSVAKLVAKHEAASPGEGEVLARRLFTEVDFAATDEDGNIRTKSMFQMLGSPYCLPILLPVLFLLAIGWFVLLRFAAHCAVWCTAGVFVAMCVFAFILMATMDAWPILVVGLGFLIYMIAVRAQINQGCQCLQGGLHALSEMSMSLPVIVAIGIMLLVYLSLMFTFIVNAAFNQTWILDKTSGTCRAKTLAETVSGGGSPAFFFVINFWYMVLHFTIAFAIGCWYFHKDDPQAPPQPMVDGFRRALFSRNGNGVCGQAGIVMAIVDYIENELKKAQRNPCVFLNPIMCIMYCVMSALKSCLESLTTFAVVAVALEGGGFCATARDAANTLGIERTARFLIIDSTLGWLLKLQAVLIATAFGFLCFFVIDTSEDLDIIKSITQGAKDIKNAADEHDGSGNTMIVWFLTMMVCGMMYMMRKPLTFILILILLQVAFSQAGIDDNMPAVAGAVMAAIMIGCIGSLVMHMFAEAGSAALCAMTYCWCLDEAIPNPEGQASASKQNARQMVKGLMSNATDVHAGGTFGSFNNNPQPVVATSPVVEMGGGLSGAPRVPGKVNVQCPPGVMPGQQVMAEINGVQMAVTVPPGVSPGQIFQVDY